MARDTTRLEDQYKKEYDAQAAQMKQLESVDWLQLDVKDLTKHISELARLDTHIQDLQMAIGSAPEQIKAAYASPHLIHTMQGLVRDLLNQTKGHLASLPVPVPKNETKEPSSLNKHPSAGAASAAGNAGPSETPGTAAENKVDPHPLLAPAELTPLEMTAIDYYGLPPREVRGLPSSDILARILKIKKPVADITPQEWSVAILYPNAPGEGSFLSSEATLRTHAAVMDAIREIIKPLSAAWQIAITTPIFWVKDSALISPAVCWPPTETLDPSQTHPASWLRPPTSKFLATPLYQASTTRGPDPMLRFMIEGAGHYYMSRHTVNVFLWDKAIQLAGPLATMEQVYVELFSLAIKTISAPEKHLAYQRIISTAFLEPSHANADIYRQLLLSFFRHPLPQAPYLEVTLAESARSAVVLLEELVQKGLLEPGTEIGDKNCAVIRAFPQHARQIAQALFDLESNKQPEDIAFNNALHALILAHPQYASDIASVSHNIRNGLQEVESHNTYCWEQNGLTAIQYVAASIKATGTMDASRLLAEQVGLGGVHYSRTSLNYLVAHPEYEVSFLKGYRVLNTAGLLGLYSDLYALLVQPLYAENVANMVVRLSENNLLDGEARQRNLQKLSEVAQHAGAFVRALGAYPGKLDQQLFDLMIENSENVEQWIKGYWRIRKSWESSGEKFKNLVAIIGSPQYAEGIGAALQVMEKCQLLSGKMGDHNRQELLRRAPQAHLIAPILGGLLGRHRPSDKAFVPDQSYFNSLLACSDETIVTLAKRGMEQEPLQETLAILQFAGLLKEDCRDANLTQILSHHSNIHWIAGMLKGMQSLGILKKPSRLLWVQNKEKNQTYFDLLMGHKCADPLKKNIQESVAMCLLISRVLVVYKLLEGKNAHANFDSLLKICQHFDDHKVASDSRLLYVYEVGVFENELERCLQAATGSDRQAVWEQLVLARLAANQDDHNRRQAPPPEPPPPAKPALASGIQRLEASHLSPKYKEKHIKLIGAHPAQADDLARALIALAPAAEDVAGQEKLEDQFQPSALLQDSLRKYLPYIADIAPNLELFSLLGGSRKDREDNATALFNFIKEKEASQFPAEIGLALRCLKSAFDALRAVNRLTWPNVAYLCTLREISVLTLFELGVNPVPGSIHDIGRPDIGRLAVVLSGKGKPRTAGEEANLDNLPPRVQGVVADYFSPHGHYFFAALQARNIATRSRVPLPVVTAGPGPAASAAGKRGGGQPPLAVVRAIAASAGPGSGNGGLEDKKSGPG